MILVKEVKKVMGKIKKGFIASIAPIKVEGLKDRIVDNESKKILGALLADNKRCTDDVGGEVFKRLIDKGQIFSIPELEKFSGKKYEIIICKYKKEWHNEYTRLLIDHSRWNGKYQILDEKDLLNYSAKDAVLCFPRYGIENKKELVRAISRNKWILHEIEHGNTLFGKTGTQYLDVFQPRQKEVIINAGSFDGETDVEFVEWAGKDCKIYAFEPIQKNVKKIERKIEENGIVMNVTIMPVAAGDQNKDVYFIQNKDSSCETRKSFDDDNAVRIQMRRIDDMIQDEVTFIKMDIEGSELKALIGSQKIIKKYKPRLAICIYHKPSDVYSIPDYILSLVPEYRFAIRHYTSFLWETVLYGSCNMDDFKNI